MKHPQLNFRQPKVDRFIEVMTTAKIFLAPDIKGEILQNINEYKLFAEKLQTRVYEMMEDVKDQTTFTFLNLGHIESDFCIRFNTTHFKASMFNPEQPESIDIIAARIIKAKNNSYPGKQKKESMPLSKLAQIAIIDATEKDFKTVKDVTDCMVLGTAIALLDGKKELGIEHILDAIQYKICKIYKNELAKEAT